MATFTQRKPSGGSTQRGGDTLRGPSGLPPVVEYPTMSILGVPLSVRLTTSRASRFVSREVRDLRYASAISGGFSSLEIELDRPLSLDPDEIQWYGEVTVYGPGAEVLWQGRLEDPGRTAGPQGEIWQIKAVGPAAHARDRAVPLIYVDQSLERWGPHGGGQPAAGRAEIVHTNVIGGAGKMLAQCPRGVVAVATTFFAGRQYNAIREAGMKLARYSYTWDTGRTNADWRVRTSTGVGGISLNPTDLAFNTAGGTAAGVVVTNFSNGHDTITMVIQRITSNETVADDDTWGTFAEIKLRTLLLDKAGAEITTGYTLNTVLASEVVADLLGRLLPEFDGANAVIATTSHAIDQLAYPDPVTAAQVLDDLAFLEPGHFWAAWEGAPAKFEYSAWPATVGLEASAKDGFDSPGSTSEVFNAVAVRWRDNFGRIRVNRRTNTVPLLDAAGLTREATLDLGDEMGSSIGADRAGDQFLSEHSAAPNAGTLRVQRPILSMALGRMLDPWELVRHAPGKLIRVRDVLPRVDALNATARDGVTIMKCVRAAYEARDNSCQLYLDSQPKILTRLLSPMTPLPVRRR